MRTLLALSLSLLAACGGADAAGAGKPRFAFVTNCVADFWEIGRCGVEAAGAELGVDVSVYMPTGPVEEQKRTLEDLVAKGVDGIAVSPKDPANMTDLLDRIAARTLLITHDSDAPESRRLAYVGMSNYDAGRLCGQLIRQTLPEGAVVVIVVGTLDQDNAKGRRQGLVDELLGRDRDPSRFDPQEAVLKAGGYEIRATYTDEFDRAKGKAVAQDALARWDDVDCLVGLFEYEPPLLLEAVQSASRLGAVKVVGFDEADQTLQGIVDGHIAGTVVQDPYNYGYQSMVLLAKLFGEGDPEKRRALLPPGGFLDIPVRLITKDNVRAFWDDKNRKTGKQ